MLMLLMYFANYPYKQHKFRPSLSITAVSFAITRILWVHTANIITGRLFHSNGWRKSMTVFFQYYERSMGVNSVLGIGIHSSGYHHERKVRKVF